MNDCIQLDRIISYPMLFGLDCWYGRGRICVLPSAKNLGYRVQVIVLPKQYIGVVRFLVLLYCPQQINLSRVVLKEVSENKDINSRLVISFKIFVLDKAIEDPLRANTNTWCFNDDLTYEGSDICPL